MLSLYDMKKGVGAAMAKNAKNCGSGANRGSNYQGAKQKGSSKDTE